MILDLVRHGSTGRPGCLDGRADPPLASGAAEAVRSAHAGIPWRHVFSSPRRRSLDTARALADGEPAVQTAWAELDFGKWDGCAAEDLDSTALAAFHEDPGRHGPPGGEDWACFEQRIRQALVRLVQLESGDDPILVVSHAGPLRMALVQACGWPLTVTWSVRIAHGTRLRLRVGTDDDRRLWGEVLELRTI